ncbi:Vacuolar protein sorting-associated protein Ist1 protein [Dioscorea alata]|uniref:Vacuolar protein sorting-associated protein Ist1 protein n=2 Tax=Dioscorea alata TaxID=55571 RepID=A0ACB7WED1_DIOAL|nr:Vacuolar protein sorting-associated protein Ist1 protein [Dioscorea alata]KAH7686411.1 Vacuolar protein sorting-associated protein Ist1 protein [Dioscorea alata]
MGSWMFRKSKSFASELLPKSFKAEKCKIALKLVRTRLTLTKNKKGIHVKQMRRDIAMLLAAGQDQTALIRVEHVIREEKNMSVYELIDIYCELIIAQLPIIESRKNCPVELKEAISSVIFASSRCADIPEIIDVRKQFVAKYGKEFIIAALEVRPECGVSSMLVEKLSAKAPDSKTKMKALSSIAEEFNIKWDIKPLEDQNHMPSDDLLTGPKTFASASQTPTESPNANYSPTPSIMNEQSQRMSQNDVVSKTPSFKDSPRSSINTTSMPFTASHSRVSENRGSRSSWEEVNSAYQTDGSLNQQNWNMGFKDATSAAQAAAESAERASVAARAAAELARRESASYNEIKQNIKESVPLQFNEIKQSSESVMEAEDRNTDEVTQARSEKAGRRNYDYMNPSRSFSYSPSYSHELSSDDDLLEVNRKTEGRPFGYATFDDSDGQSSDGGDVIDNIMSEEEMKSTNLQHNHMFPDNVEFISPPLPDINYPDMSYDSNTEERERLSLGRLTGGFRNKGFPDPPYLRDPLPGTPVPSKPVYTRAMEGCVASQEKSLEPNLHGCRTDASPSGVFRGFDKFIGSDLHHSCGRRVHVAESSPTLSRVARNNSDIEEQTLYHQNQASINSENLVYDSYSLKSMARDGNLYSSRAYGRSKSALLPPKDINIAPSIEKNVSFSEKAFSSHGVSNEEFPYQRQTVRTNREPMNCFDQDVVKAEPQYTLGFKSDRCDDLSRTRDLPSANVYGYHARSYAYTEMESEFFGGSFSSEPINTQNRGMHIDRRDSSRSSEQNISFKQSSMTSSNVDSLLRKDNFHKSQVNSEASKIPSRESSFKSVSHVHPKLPDYDTIVAQFQALRANRQ